MLIIVEFSTERSPKFKDKLGQNLASQILFLDFTLYFLCDYATDPNRRHSILQ